MQERWGLAEIQIEHFKDRYQCAWSGVVCSDDSVCIF